MPGVLQEWWPCFIQSQWLGVKGFVLFFLLIMYPHVGMELQVLVCMYDYFVLDILLNPGSDLLVFPDASSARLCHFLCWTVLFSAIWSKMTACCLHCATVLLKDISIRKFLRITGQSARNRKQNVCQLMEQDVHLSSGCVKISLKTRGHFKLLVCGSTLVSRALFKTTVPATSCE